MDATEACPDVENDVFLSKLCSQINHKHCLINWLGDILLNVNIKQVHPDKTITRNQVQVKNKPGPLASQGKLQCCLCHQKSSGQLHSYVTVSASRWPSVLFVETNNSHLDGWGHGCSDLCSQPSPVPLSNTWRALSWSQPPPDIGCRSCRDHHVWQWSHPTPPLRKTVRLFRQGHAIFMSRCGIAVVW